MIIELFGLSNTGKSYLKKKLEEKEHLVVKIEEISSFVKFIYLLKYLMKHPITSIYLFYSLNNNHLTLDTLSINKRIRILKMRNSYFAFVLSKYEQIKNKKENIFIDEFSHQALFMIIQNKSSEKELKKIIKRLPEPDALLLFEKSKEKRHKSYKKPHPFKQGASHYPGSWIDKKYAKEWMAAMEHNFEIIKKIIQEKAEKDDSFFPALKLNLPKDYIRDIKISTYKLL